MLKRISQILDVLIPATNVTLLLWQSRLCNTIAKWDYPWVSILVLVPNVMLEVTEGLMFRSLVWWCLEQETSLEYYNIWNPKLRIEILQTRASHMSLKTKVDRFQSLIGILEWRRIPESLLQDSNKKQIFLFVEYLGVSNWHLPFPMFVSNM